MRNRFDSHKHIPRSGLACLLKHLWRPLSRKINCKDTMYMKDSLHFVLRNVTRWQEKSWEKFSSRHIEAIETISATVGENWVRHMSTVIFSWPCDSSTGFLISSVQLKCGIFNPFQLLKIFPFYLFFTFFLVFFNDFNTYFS